MVTDILLKYIRDHNSRLVTYCGYKDINTKNIASIVNKLITRDDKLFKERLDITLVDLKLYISNNYTNMESVLDYIQYWYDQIVSVMRNHGYGHI